MIVQGLKFIRLPSLKCNFTSLIWPMITMLLQVSCMLQLIPNFLSFTQGQMEEVAYRSSIPVLHQLKTSLPREICTWPYQSAFPSLVANRHYISPSRNHFFLKPCTIIQIVHFPGTTSEKGYGIRSDNSLSQVFMNCI